MIKEIVKTIEEITEGDIFVRVIGEFDSCPYFGGVKGLEIDGKVFKKIDNKIYDCKVKSTSGTRGLVVDIENYQTEYNLNALAFAVYKNEQNVNIANSCGISSNLKHETNK